MQGLFGCLARKHDTSKALEALWLSCTSLDLPCPWLGCSATTLSGGGKALALIDARLMGSDSSSLWRMYDVFELCNSSERLFHSANMEFHLHLTPISIKAWILPLVHFHLAPSAIQPLHWISKLGHCMGSRTSVWDALDAMECADMLFS